MATATRGCPGQFTDYNILTQFNSHVYIQMQAYLVTTGSFQIYTA